MCISEGEDSVAPGQACVVYDSARQGAQVLGGGVITRKDNVASLPIQPPIQAHALTAR